MVFEILLPDLGEGTDEGSIVAWSKKVGDRVAAGDVLCEIEAGKTVVQVTYARSYRDAAGGEHDSEQEDR